MRAYDVPFTTQGEEKLIFNLSVKQVLIIGISAAVGFLAANILSKILDTFLLFCFPVALPFIGIGAILAFTKIKKHGKEFNFGEFLYYKTLYKYQPKHFLRKRHFEETNSFK